MMVLLATVAKYIFVTAVVVEVGLILRALIALARGKARAAEPPAIAAEE
ncbi:MAG TPA: hypothetical protein VKE41_17660 [Roseiflexaceae bacterium]|nr:hypothetical protein [Roseiflexaceae bacterium]